MSDKQIVHYEPMEDRPGAPSKCGNKDRHSWVVGDPDQVTCPKCLEIMKNPEVEEEEEDDEPIMDAVR